MRQRYKFEVRIKNEPVTSIVTIRGTDLIDAMSKLSNYDLDPSFKTRRLTDEEAMEIKKQNTKSKSDIHTMLDPLIRSSHGNKKSTRNKFMFS